MGERTRRWIRGWTEGWKNNAMDMCTSRGREARTHAQTDRATQTDVRTHTERRMDRWQWMFLWSLTRSLLLLLRHDIIFFAQPSDESAVRLQKQPTKTHPRTQLDGRSKEQKEQK